jgi:hypothetical protein
MWHLQLMWRCQTGGTISVCMHTPHPPTLRIFLLPPLQSSALMLALAHTYYCRLGDTELRGRFVERVVVGSYRAAGLEVVAGDFRKVLAAEQGDYVNRMELPEGGWRGGVSARGSWVAEAVRRGPRLD